MAAVALLSMSGGAGDARAAGVVPVEGIWTGETQAGLPVSFEVKEGQVVNARFRFRWGFCETFDSAEPKSTPIDASGSWKYLDIHGPWMQGTFAAPDRVSGTVVAPSRSTPGCPLSEVTFVAAPGAPAPVAEPKVRVVVEPVTGALAERPSKISPYEKFEFEATSDLYFYALEWQSFGGPVARATGRGYTRWYFLNGGKEVKRPHVTLRLSRLVRRGANLVYTRLHFAFDGSVSPHFPREGSFGPPIYRHYVACGPSPEARPFHVCPPGKTGFFFESSAETVDYTVCVTPPDRRKRECGRGFEAEKGELYTDFLDLRTTGRHLATWYVKGEKVGSFAFRIAE